MPLLNLKNSVKRHLRVALVCLIWAIAIGSQKAWTVPILELRQQSFCEAQIENIRSLWDFFRSVKTGIPSQVTPPAIAISPGVRLYHHAAADQGLQTDVNTLFLGPTFRRTLEDQDFIIYSRGRRDRNKISALVTDLKQFTDNLVANGFSKFDQKTTLVLDNRWTLGIQEHSLLADLIQVAKLSAFPESDLNPKHESAFAFVDNLNRSLIILPEFPTPKSVFDRSILFHEQMHVLLIASVPRENPIHTKRFINEALADFGSSLGTGSPHLGGFRWIERAPPLNAIFFDEKDPYTPSLLFSSVLYQLREKIGEREMTRIFFPFVKALSEDLMGVPPSDSFKQDVLNHHAQFLATLKRVSGQ